MTARFKAIVVVLESHIHVSALIKNFSIYMLYINSFSPFLSLCLSICLFVSGSVCVRALHCSIRPHSVEIQRKISVSFIEKLMTSIKVLKITSVEIWIDG